MTRNHEGKLVRRQGRGIAALLGTLLLFASPCPKARACDSGHPPGRLSREAALLRSEVPIALVEGIGSVHFPTTTSSASAQGFFDQGLAHLFSYAWWPAARSFRQALREDRAFPMAHWGLAAAFLELEAPELAQEQMNAALAGREAASETERRWIEAGALRLEAARAVGRERFRLHRAYRTALDALIEAAGTIAAAEANPWPWLLRGTADEYDVLGRGQNGGESTLGYYRRALEAAPEFFPAHHFLTHTLENLGRYEEAAEHARRYRDLAPAVPHAHHMLAHVLPALGRWQEARAAFLEADRLHGAEAAASGIPPLESWHYAHNRRFLALVEHHLGHQAPARSYARSIFALPATDWRGALYCAPWIEVLLAQERFAEAAAAAAQCSRLGSPGAEAVGAAFSAEAALGSGGRAEAERLLEAARAALGELPEGGLARPAAADLAQQQVEWVEILLALSAPREAEAAEALARLGRLTERWLAEPRFDGWSQAVLLRLPRLEAYARRHGRRQLADELHASFSTGVRTVGVH